MSQEEQQIVVGIDVSKARLDIAARGEEWPVTNDLDGISRIIGRLQTLNPGLTVVESTRGLERLVVAEMWAAGLPVALVNPRRVREFGKSIGLLAKTDRIDARLLVRFGEAVKTNPICLPSEEEQKLSALMTRRRQVIEMLTMEKNHLCSSHPAAKESITKIKTVLQQELDELDHQIEEFIDQFPSFKKKARYCVPLQGLEKSLQLFYFPTCQN